MSHVPTVLKSDRSVFDKMLPVDDNVPGAVGGVNWFQVVQINNWSCITPPPAYPDVNGDVDVTKTMPTQ